MLSSVIDEWLQRCLGDKPKQVLALAGDASFRQYYRIQTKDNKSLILMINPPANGNNESFLYVANLLEQWGVRVPERMATNAQLGTILLSDMGDRLLLKALAKETELSLYKKALQALHPMQLQCKANWQFEHLPVFDVKFMMMEMHYFSTWLLSVLLKISLTEQEQQQLEEAFAFIAKAVAQQPYVFIHRDYHSRNLMVLPQGPLGVLDFQDAMMGPITYDVVSLLRDCYYVISTDVLHTLLHYYHQQFCGDLMDFEQLQQWFRITIIQRHVKVAGIFARLACRDGKKQFIQDIPVALHYLLETLPYYNGLSFLQELIEERILPALKQQQMSVS